VANSPVNAQVKYYPFDPEQIEHYLQLSAPPFTSADKAFQQLRYVARYARDLKCRTVVIESHYIDRDYIEDHSVFYAKSLYPYTNYCQRMHFFSINREQVEKELQSLVQLDIQKGGKHFRQACQRFSVDRIRKLCTTIPLPRYVGIVRLAASFFEPIDILIDTTSSRNNIHCLNIIIVNGTRGHTTYMAQHLANVYGCHLLV
jgi:hypothetical protein